MCSSAWQEIVLSRLFEWCELAVTQQAFEWLAAQHLCQHPVVSLCHPSSFFGLHVTRQCSPDLRRVLLGSRLSSLKKGSLKAQIIKVPRTCLKPCCSC